MRYPVRIIDKNSERTVLAEEGELLMDIVRDARFYIEAPCGGKGKCRKCTVHVDGTGNLLSCMTKVTGDLLPENADEIVVRIPDRGGAVIKSLGLMPDFFLNPLIRKMSIRLDPPSVENQLPDDRRIERATGATVASHILPALPGILRAADFHIDCLIRQDINEVIRIEPVGTSPALRGVSIDIGTTTLSVSLFDLSTGKHIRTASSLNPQKAFGADVISRIDFASRSAEDLATLQDRVLEKIIDHIQELDGGEKSVQTIAIAGNTTMMHLLCGIDPTAIAKAPFIPVTLDGRIRYFHELFPRYTMRLDMDPVCILLPSISGYVGADITAGILAMDLDQPKRNSLLVDIGTNGEIALSADGRIISCSTAAGPAFEGANITCGTGGIVGAVDRVVYEDFKLDFSTIGNQKPVGICGSGIVSMISSFLKSGVIDETGRFCDEPETLPEEIAKGLIEKDGNTVYALETTDDGNPLIYMTQKDVREIQNAKAAVCAGIRLLISRSGLAPNDIDDVFIAGGFGNFMDISDAFSIGLLPPELRGKAIPVGNSAATGAALCMLDYRSYVKTLAITQKVRYFELSSDKEFTDLYIDAMMFE
jgi:uncharacterized 2Fe-2S/4Fe-4S cluster protein (DUF4445 family)